MDKQTPYKSYGEIHEQYIQLRQTAQYIQSQKDAILHFFETGTEIVYLACGSSYWMSLSAKSTMRVRAKRKSYAIKAGDVLLNPDEFQSLFENPVFVCPSRSGSTSEVIEAIKILKNFYPNARLLSLVEYEHFALESVSDLCLRLPWANAQSVCQTRSFSCLYLANILIAGMLGGESILEEQVQRYLSLAPQYYERDIPVLKSIVEQEKMDKLICLGSGTQYGVCIEGAYIVIEVAEYASQYFQMLEYRHGPIVLTDASTLVFMVSSRQSKPYEGKVISEITRAHGKVYLVSTQANPDASHTFLVEEEFCDEIVALHFVFCLQSIAYRTAVHLGRNPDCPGSLTPFIEL